MSWLIYSAYPIPTISGPGLDTIEEAQIRSGLDTSRVFYSFSDNSKTISLNVGEVQNHPDSIFRISLTTDPQSRTSSYRIREKGREFLTEIDYSGALPVSLRSYDDSGLTAICSIDAYPDGRVRSVFGIYSRPGVRVDSQTWAYDDHNRILRYENSGYIMEYFYGASDQPDSSIWLSKYGGSPLVTRYYWQDGKLTRLEMGEAGKTGYRISEFSYSQGNPVRISRRRPEAQLRGAVMQSTNGILFNSAGSRFLVSGRRSP